MSNEPTQSATVNTIN